MMPSSCKRAVRRLIAQDDSTSGNYSRFDLAIAILLGIAIAAWLVSYAALMVLYGHDRTATSGNGSVYRLTSS
jgi:hypothetical protein